MLNRFKNPDLRNKRLSEAGKRLWTDPVYRQHMSDIHKGYKMTDEQRLKLSESRRGRLSHFWQGGITKVNELERHSLRYRFWRKSVYERDGYTCQECKKVGGSLNAHHIKSWAHNSELRFELSNGITLCTSCHGLTDSFCGRNKNKLK